MSTLAGIFGWTPPENEDYVQVTVHLPNSLQNPPFHISDATNTTMRTLRSRYSRSFPSKMEVRSPTSSTSALSSGGESPDKRQEKGKNGDPTWVARPRNEFILFRCEYVKTHSREGKRVRRPPGTEAEKTLSKQAAEAWHQLSEEERMYWRNRARGERTEHARRYPDYRYRPKKSATGRKRNTRSSSEKVPSGKSASTAATAVVAVTVNPGAGGMQQTHSETTQDSSKSNPGPQTACRRSTSVPLLSEHQTRVESNEQINVTTHGWWVDGSAPSCSTTTISEVSAMLLAKTKTKDSQSLSSRLYHSTSIDNFTASDYSPSLSSITNSASASISSLLNWNGGERTVPSPAPRPGAPFLVSPSPMSLSLSPLTIFENNTFVCQQPKYPNSVLQLGLVAQYDRNGAWMSNVPLHFTDSGLLQNATSSQEMLGGPSSVVYDERSHGHLIYEYGLGTQEPTPMEVQLGHDSHADVLFAMDTEEHFPRF
ncbi:hypothetical protein K443DRAFT_94014 [Laccaria amethystina LaAM-08-1]|uniref:HMG box domain-containing protein n=1 Tax=Laccaria amethystina LaAM-08-1 TaxID=1095629 RepID=A0A0C9XGK5_9AGAR|nr:hypothetical protein K443DRAFT_94014 [Laccaria amethystina LaAM-08-1]